LKAGFFDIVGGASGDMILAALIDAGADPEGVTSALRPAGLQFHLRTETASDHGIRVRRVKVEAPEEHAHRHLADIRELLAQAELPKRAGERAIAAFEALAEAEAEAHGSDASHVHFHEVGAVDAIVDIAGAAVLAEDLGLGLLTASPVPLARGTIECAHGTLPAPAPATVNLLRGIPVTHSDLGFENVTPTGAAILRTLCDGFGGMPAMTLQRVGVGAGSRESVKPNWLRLLVGSVEDEGEEETVVGIETNVDDMTPEAIAHLMARMMAAGALDCYATPALMKKGRPGSLLTVLAGRADGVRLGEMLLAESSTFGVRFSEMNRLCLPRETVKVETPYGEVRIKVGRPVGREPKVAPEFDDCREAAERHRVPLAEVQQAALAAYLRL
jgi:uncharacterized protein (TIGR00299 family) protein